MTNQEDWQPSCSMEILRVRAAMLHAVRKFFHQRGYLEVETPCLSRDIVIDAWLEPMRVEQGGQNWFLQTSPEACMKRLLAAGSGSIFQISRVFRAGESGTRHNPEFTMIEWYGVESTWQQQMELTEWLVRACLAEAATVMGYTPVNVWPDGEFRQTTYQTAFQRVFHMDVHRASHDELLHAAVAQNVPLPDTCSMASKDDVLNAMLAFAVEPSLGRNPSTHVSAPEFLCDYPASQAALAVTSETLPHVARRFELYIDGLELCNGYQELTDPEELQRRERLQNSVRSGSSLETLPGAARLQAAMKAGLPECSGVAMGFDRLVMIATKAASISEVLAFPADRV
jgi:lysyl-tRNA synthetase class 2